MESDIVHQQLNTISNEAAAQRTLVCYLQYLIAYRRDVPNKDEYVTYELQSLQSTQYVKKLAADNPIRMLLSLSDELEEADEKHGKLLWSKLKNGVANL